MKYLVIAFYFFILFNDLTAQNKIVNQGDYKFEIPENWDKVSNNIISKKFKIDSLNIYKYNVIGYTQDDTLLEDRPYFFCIYNKIVDYYNDKSFQDIITNLKRLENEKNIEIKIDTSNYKYYFETDSNKTISGCSYGRDGELYITFFPRYNSYIGDKEIFLNIFNSIKHNNAFGSNSEYEKHMKRSGKYALYAIILLIIVILGRLIMRLHK